MRVLDSESSNYRGGVAMGKLWVGGTGPGVTGDAYFTGDLHVPSNSWGNGVSETLNGVRDIDNPRGGEWTNVNLGDWEWNGVSCADGSYVVGVSLRTQGWGNQFALAVRCREL